MDISTHLPMLFGGYSGAIAALVAVGLGTVFHGWARILALAALAAWLAYATAFSASGLLADPNLRPPPALLLVAPVLAALVAVIGISPAGAKLAGLPPAPLIGFQLFRLGVELTISALHDAGLAPRLMTLSGGNVEILVALTAPVAAWVSTRGATGRRIATLWLLLGIASLLNVAARAVLSAPGPLHLLTTEVPNIAFAHFPFGLIPGFMAPLALATQLLALRALNGARQRSAAVTPVTI